MLDVVSVVVRLVACDVVRDEVTEVAGAWSGLWWMTKFLDLLI